MARLKLLLRAALSGQPIEVAGLLLAVQLFYAPISNWLQNHPPAAWLLAAATVVAVLLLQAVQARRQRRSGLLGANTAFEGPRAKRRGLVVTVAGNRSFDRTGLARLLGKLPDLELVGLLGTARFTQEELRTYAAEIRARSPRVREVRGEHGNEGSVRDLEARAGLLLNWMLDMGLDPADIGVDVTEGFKPLSIAAYQAATGRGVECQYTQSDYVGDERTKGTERTGVLT